MEKKKQKELTNFGEDLQLISRTPQQALLEKQRPFLSRRRFGLMNDLNNPRTNVNRDSI